MYGPGPGAGLGAGPSTTGGPERALDPVLEHLLRNVRSRHVRQHFARTPAVEYTQLRTATIQAATFNVAGKKPPPGLRLDEWLGAGPAAGGMKGRWPQGAEGGSSGGAAGAGGGSGSGSNGPDILAVGFVEIVPLNAGNVMGVWGTAQVDAWDRCLAVYLNGEEWAAERYGPSAAAVASQAAAAAAAATALLETKWQGGGNTAPDGGAATAPNGNTPNGAVNGGGGGGTSGSDEEYVQVASKQLVGVYLSVWVRRRLLPAVRGVQVTTVATGFGGYLGNKGAVAARLRLYDSSLVFVASHLTAGDAEGDELRRNADVHDILRRAVFVSAPDGGGGAASMTAASAALISASLGPDVRAAIRAGRWEPLLAADQLSRERAAGRVFQGWHEGRVTFPPTYKFKAGTNTYNGDDMPASGSAGSLQAAESAAVAPAAAAAEDAESSSAASAGPGSTADPEKHKRRTPAWCDRVLWWTKHRGPDATGGSQRPGTSGSSDAGGGGDGGVVGSRLRQLAYWRGELTVSDHKPVAAGFAAEVVSYDRRRIEGLLEAGMRAVDRMQESLRPRVTVEPVVLDAGEWVALGRPQPLQLRITNTGSVEALFHFIPPPQEPSPSLTGRGGKFGLDDETPPLPPWLEAQPAEGVVQPGQSCEVVLTVLVEGGGPGTAAQLLFKSGSLDCILILRIEDSGDKFITIGGRYRQSFVGTSLEDLSRLGNRSVLPPAEAAALAERLGLGQLQPQLQQLQEGGGAHTHGGADDDDDDGAVVPPKEVLALVSALTANSAAALRVPGILADSAALVLAREGYDTGAATAAAAAAVGQAAQLRVQDGEEVPAAAAAMQPTGREAQRALLRLLEPLRLILDAGGLVPVSADPHDVAALLLLWCRQLPYPLIPASVADAAAAAPPTSPADAVALLRRHCGVMQLAVVSELLRLLRAALAPDLVDCNGLTAPRLAAVAAAWWMPPLGAGSAAGAVNGLRALLEMLLSDGNAAAAAAAAD
ncbi:hypothetical protein VOLCADRAFT_105199 [Volvox carteri f. nagariensis]|uniref:Inositol polyphosphate-related phosphatase domain-containing protein n=1 Tax=Volvox carteri f. nagariensis TaxID=3068 RepID=D8TZ81_VOLCA|nr:uncharacterized protein VOLCADRAFT_105199 [Volvox carteri f. nagariensis]EFJ47134.1 hypothetical protein VOLCADRAFT_105199 [Volvox carteri f. nagariensis]|eukprot:XP_002951683.1 hypothetical protein VOLCADRAFT_105199 [Volvox carteri f. nagariensis]